MLELPGNKIPAAPAIPSIGPRRILEPVLADPMKVRYMLTQAPEQHPLAVDRGLGPLFQDIH